MLISKLDAIKITDECNQSHTYIAQEFHFHAPSEHTIEGKTHPFEMYIVHTIADEPTAKFTHCVVGIFFEISKTDSELVKSIDFKGLNSNAKLDLQSFIQEGCNEFYMYKGSLTTPPCTECVQWISLKSVRGITKETLDLFNGQLKTYNQCPNARGTLPLNGRVVFKNK